MNNKILFVLNHAPHYRELFLRKFGEQVNLTVFAKPCSSANLIEPQNRKNYKYFESFSNHLFSKIGFQVNFLEWKLLRKSWDKVILSWDLHHIFRYLFFIFTGNKKNIFWMGHIYGSSNSKLIKFTRKYFLNHSGGVLTYSNEIVEKLKVDGINAPLFSFNNSEVSISDIHACPFDFIQNKIKLLYVGRFQKRKRLERLIQLAKINPNVIIHIAGNGVKELLNIYPEIESIPNVELFGEILNDELKKQMEWCDMIVNPGHLGLLVVNGARFGRPILVDNSSQHAPEVIVAKEAEQFFVDWTDIKAVDNLVEKLIENRELIQEASQRIVEIVKLKYTVEYMVQIYVRAIKTVK